MRAVTAALGEVGLADPQRCLRQFPHELSGGMLQRVMVAAALAAQPRLLIADEPTPALDVTTQSDLMALLAGEPEIWQCCSSLTTWNWRPPPATGWPSCMPVGSSKRSGPAP